MLQLANKCSNTLTVCVLDAEHLPLKAACLAHIRESCSSNVWTHDGEPILDIVQIEKLGGFASKCA